MKMFERFRLVTILGRLGLAFASFSARADVIKDCAGDDEEVVIKACSELIRRNPKNHVAFYNRGIAYDATRHHREAIEDYSSAIKIDPKVASYFHNRGVSHSALEELDRAIEDYSTALKLDPNSERTYRNRAWARARANKDLKEALTDSARDKG